MKHLARNTILILFIILAVLCLTSWLIPAKFISLIDDELAKHEIGFSIGELLGMEDTDEGIEIPTFSGNSIIVLNDNQPQFTDSQRTWTRSFEEYANLDKLGRCGPAMACIGSDLMPTEERGAIGMIKPSGWQTVRYNDLIEGNYLYNRCHLIMYALTGENDNEKNLITGTRYFNASETGGMLAYEEKVLYYMYDHPGNHVMYRVTPIFAGRNLVATGVQMEAYSVEDKGEGVCFNVFVYNVQPGIYIDYSDGSSCIDSKVVVNGQ